MGKDVEKSQPMVVGKKNSSATIKKNLAFPQNIKQNHHMTSQFH
jgi:hypothetical protein